MCGIILLIFGIVYAVRIPKLLRSTPADYPGCSPAIHAEWRGKELMSIYVFLAATWGQSILFFILGIVIGLASGGGPERLAELVMVLSGIEIVVFLGGLIWAAILGSQAAKLKKQLVLMPSGPAGYYPRPGQTTLQAPPQGSWPPPAETRPQGTWPPPAEAPPPYSEQPPSGPGTGT